MEPIVTAEGADRVALPEALSELPLPFKATLELACRRGLDDSTIADIAGLEEAEIARQRERALEWLAGRTGSDGGAGEVEEGLRQLSSAGWAGEAEQVDEAAPDERADVPDSEEEEQDSAERAEPRPFPILPSSPTAAGRDRHRSARRRLTAVALAAAAVVAVIVIASIRASDSSDPRVARDPATSQPSRGEEGTGGETGDGAEAGADSGGEEAPAAVAMIPLAGAEAEGDAMASLTGGSSRPRLELALEGFAAPEGEYRAWLYNSVIDSVPLGSTGEGDGTIGARLPDGWQSFSFVDVSIQGKGDEAHSGRSVVRIATADLGAP